MIFLPKQLQSEFFNFIRVEGKNPGINGKGWQLQIHSFHEAEDWLSKGFNYGVMGGHGGLLIMDADSKAVEEAVEKSLPETFTVKSGSGKKHYYFLCPEISKKITLDDKISPSLFLDGEDHYGEGITWGGQAVGPGSIHPDTKKYYEVFKDIPIVHINKDQLMTTLAPFLKKVESDVIPQTHSHLNELKITDIISVNKTQNIVHPVHGSKNGGNLNIDVEKNLWYCFRCETGGGPLSLLAVLEGVIDCSDAGKGSLRGENFIKTAKIAEERFGLKCLTSKTQLNKTVTVKPKYSPLIHFKELMTKEYPAARFTVDKYFEAGTLNMVSAPPNTWKSWLLFFFAAEIAKGGYIWNKFSTEKSKVMFVNEEDTCRSIQERFNILGITDTNLDMYFHVMEGIKITQESIDVLVKEVKENDIKVVILDSLRAIHDANENDSQEMQRIMDLLKQISKLEVTVIFTHHHRKKGQFEKGDNPESSRGSSAVNAAVSGHISLDEEIRETGTYLIIRHMKSKAVEKIPPIEVKINKSIGHVSFTYEGNFKDFTKKIQVSKDAVMKCLEDSGRWMTYKDFNETKVASPTIIKEAVRELKKENRLIWITRKDAKEQNMRVEGSGKANEMLFAINPNKEEVVTQEGFDAFAKDLQTVDPNEVPI